MLNFKLQGEFIKPNEVKCILNEGMPMYKNPYEKGRLIITFNIKFPEAGQIDLKKIVELEKILPARPKIDLPIEAEEHTLIDLDPAYERSKRAEQAYVDDEMQGGGKRVQCAQN